MELTEERRESIARQWLSAASQDATPERLSQVKPLVRTYHPGSHLWRAAVSLVSQGHEPTPEAVTALHEARQRRHRSRTAGVRTAIQEGRSRAAEPDLRTRVVAMVAASWAATGQGPTWRELANALDVPHLVAVGIVRQLCDEHVLRRGTEPRSLRLVAQVATQLEGKPR